MRNPPSFPNRLSRPASSLTILFVYTATHLRSVKTPALVGGYLAHQFTLAQSFQHYAFPPRAVSSQPSATRPKPNSSVGISTHQSPMVHNGQMSRFNPSPRAVSSQPSTICLKSDPLAGVFINQPTGAGVSNPAPPVPRNPTSVGFPTLRPPYPETPSPHWRRVSNPTPTVPRDSVPTQWPNNTLITPCL